MPGQRFGFTTRASCLIAAGATALVCGLVLGIVDLARAGVLALAVPLLSALVMTRSRYQIASRRGAEPARIAAGQTAVVNLTMTNRSLLPTGALMLEDQLPGQFTGRARFAIDGLLGREARTVSYRVPRLPRGRYRLGPLHLRLTDPFHLIDVRRSFTTTTDILVTPIVEALPGGEPPRSVDIGDDAGSHSIGSRGADDASTREYRTGDDLRKIHWRSSARTGSLQVRQEERPWQGQITLLLDLRAGAHREAPAHSLPRGTDERVRSSLEWAISAAASIGSQALVAGRGLDLLADLTSRRQVAITAPSQLSETLATIGAAQRSDLSPFTSILQALSQDSTVIAVLGDVDPVSLDALTQVHPRGTSRTAIALLLDSATWAQGAPDAEAGEVPPPSPRVVATANVLRSAGWRATIVRRGSSIAEIWAAVITPDGPASRAVLAAR